MKRWIILNLAVAITVLAPARVAFAHAGEPLAPHDLPNAWNWNPLIWLGLLLTVWAYARGVQALWRRGEIHPWRIWAFAGGLTALFVALISPLDAMSGALASAHMVQHMLLILVAAPLLVLSFPLGTMLLGLPISARYAIGRWWKRAEFLRAGWRMLSLPAVVWLLHASTLWLWHASALYEAALQDELVHVLEHASFFLTALLFWWTVLQMRRRKGLGYGFGVFYIFTMALVSGILGALITFARMPWYASYFETTTAWGLTPLEDQQLAGVIMWVPMGLVYTVTALVLFAAWLAASEQKESAREIGSRVGATDSVAPTNRAQHDVPA